MEKLKMWLKKITDKNYPLRNIIGAVLIILGLVALMTPFTPGSWLVFVGLEFFGIRFALWEKIKTKFFKSKK